MINPESTLWNKLAKVYEEKFMDKTIYNDTYTDFCLQIPVKGEILEIGCGPGNIAKNILKNRPDLAYHGTDYAQNMVDLAIKNNPSATFEVMDAKKLNGLTKSFDGIVAGFILPFFTKPEAEVLLKNCSRLLKSKGTFYLSFVEGDHADSHSKMGSTGDQLFFHYFELEFINELLSKNGMELLKSYVVEFHRSESKVEEHTVLIAKKIK